MHGLFPDELEVPYGPTHTRLILGLVPWVAALLVLLGIAPFYLLTWKKGLVAAALACAIGYALAKPIREDPDILEGIAGEMQLKDWYE